MIGRPLQFALIALALAVPMRLPGPLGPTEAHAQPAQTRVEKGMGEFRDLEFAAAIATLEEVLERGDATQSEKLLALELIAISYLSLGNVADSRRAFAQLLKLDRNYVLRNHDGSPKVESLFESVRAGMPVQEPAGEGTGPVETEAPEPASLAPGPSKDARAGRRYDLVVGSKGEGVKEVLLFWRPEPSTSYQSKAMRRSKGKWRARLALPDSKVDYQLQYYVLAKGVAEQTLATLGSAERPVSVAVVGADPALVGGGGKKSSAWYTRWPVWAGVGAVVVGGSIYALSSGSDEQQGALSPGRITLTP